MIKSIRNKLMVLTIFPAVISCSETSDSTNDNDSDSIGSDEDPVTNSEEGGANDDIGDRTDYSAATLTSQGAYSSSASGVTGEYHEYSSSTSDTPAIKINSGNSMTLTHTKVTKSGGGTSSEENSNFYGTNAGVLVSSSSSSTSYTSSDSASIEMTDCTITTDEDGANGVFSFGENATVTLDHVTIRTTENSSRGVDATYGGILTITNSVISTTGNHCGAIATDRYDRANAPTINASNILGTTTGDGSPGIYCTGTFNVDNATLTASGSEAAVIEGLNSITLTDSIVSGNSKWGVMIYQSMSGDSSQGTGTFTMSGGSLINNYSEGPMFFVCNTSAVITLENADLSNSSSTLLAASTAADASSCGINNVNSSWGTLGGTVTFTATDQVLAGDILMCDASSALTLTLNNSSLTSAVNNGNVDATVAIVLDANSNWEVTGDSYISELTNAGTGNISGSGRVFVNGTQVY